MAERDFRVILPKFDNQGRRINTDVLRDRAQEIADRFGGVTVYPSVLGCFVGETGRLECEENLILETTRVGANEAELESDAAWIRDFASRMGRELGQEAIFVQQETDGRTDFVPGRRAAGVAPGLLEVDTFKRLVD